MPLAAEMLGDVPLEAWAAYVSSLLRFCRGLQWVIGDLLLAGEDRYGEAYSQVLDAADYAEDTLKACRWVSARFPRVRRLTGVSWSHHQAVAALDPGEADGLLAQAERECLSARDLRALAAEKRHARQGAAAAPSPRPFDLPAEADVIEARLRARRESWPERERRHFVPLLMRVAAALADEEREADR